jgi:hypothetical protein
MKPNQKEVRIFDDEDAGIVLVRIFKFRDYSWKGGKTYEVSPNSARIGELYQLISKYSDDFLSKSPKKDTAESFILDMPTEEKLKKYYVDCYENMRSQYPVVRTKDEIVARNFKGVMYDDAKQRAEKLADIYNNNRKCNETSE